MAREMYLVGVSEEELRPDPPRQTAPQTPRSWLDNLWYHHKVAIIITLVSVIAVVGVVVQMVTRERPDYAITLVTENPYMAEETAYLELVLAAYGEDVNGDGEVIVQVSNLFLGGSQYTSQGANEQALQARLLTGNTLFYIYEPQYAQRLTAVGRDNAHCFLTELSSVPGVSADKLCWNWKEDKRHTKDLVLQDFPQELCFGVRYANADDEKSVAEYAQCVALLTAYATDTPIKK